jgi:glycosyltransferase involved in cell wall biosynthesis
VWSSRYRRPSRRSRARHGIDPSAKLVVYTGSFVPLQALDMLIAAAPLISARVPNVKFLLAGGTREEIEVLAALAAKLNVANRFIFEQNRPQVEMGGYLAAADVLVSPRFVGINPPGKLFSYLGSGNPVVATDTMVHNQLLDLSCAILTDATPEKFAEGVVTALTDPQRRAQVIAGARMFLSSYCSAEARRSAYLALTNRLTQIEPATDVPN